jgi:GNAT superfamily N-acetyltransferase
VRNTDVEEDLDLMATDPAHQRRGAAGCLLEKLAEIADQADQEIFLVSTDAARPVYEKASFVPVQEVVLSLAELRETEGRERFTVSLAIDAPLWKADRFQFMIRQPRKKSGAEGS